MKTLSIIIPAYNIEKYIDRCLDSMCSQLEPWVQVIVINDGSSDSTADHIDAYCQRYPTYIRCVPQENRGPSAARNTGLDAADSDYVWFVDGDDYIDSNAIANIGLAIEKYPETEIFFAPLLHNGKICCTGYKEDMIYTGEKFCILNPTFYTPSTIYRKSFIDRHELKFGTRNNLEDFHFNMRAFYYAERMRLINAVLYYYDNRPGSISTMRSPQHMISLSEDTIFVLNDLWIFFHRDNTCPQTFFKLIYFNVNALLYSWLIFRYPLNYIKEKLLVLKQNKLYPSGKTGSKKSDLFSLISNRKYAFLFLCRLNKMWHLFHE